VNEVFAKQQQTLDGVIMMRRLYFLHEFQMLLTIYH